MMNNKHKAKKKERTERDLLQEQRMINYWFPPPPKSKVRCVLLCRKWTICSPSKASQTSCFVKLLCNTKFLETTFKEFGDDNFVHSVPSLNLLVEKEGERSDDMYRWAFIFERFRCVSEHWFKWEDRFELVFVSHQHHVFTSLSSADDEKDVKLQPRDSGIAHFSSCSSFVHKSNLRQICETGTGLLRAVKIEEAPCNAAMEGVPWI
ncbi:hypothetical protein Fcan01_06152 [Folsomia candida]|uniref:Uncharacterized protein n=1 Tax=Folsomia candida TaxID=158441 RepID=A0A226EQ89_FOLCA|nr:hypothetical protein Fcan01_06152 [Folsomia candida]